MSLIPKTFLRGSILSAGTAVLVGVCNYLVRRLMANHLSADDYAFFYSTCSLLNFQLLLASFGTSTVLLYELPGILSRQKFKLSGTIFHFVCRFQLLLSGIVFLLLAAAIPFLKKCYYDFPVSTGLLLFFFSLIFGTTLESAGLSALNSLKRFGMASFLKALKAGLFFSTVVIALYLQSFTIVVLAYVLTTVLCAFWGIREVHLKLPDRREKTPSLLKKRILQDGLFFLILSCGYSITQDFGALTVSFFSTKNDVVLFNIAFPIAMIVYSFTSVLLVFLPLIADCYTQKDKKRLKRLFMLVMLLTSAAMIAAFPVFFWGGEWIITLLFSEKFIDAKMCTLILVEAALLSMPVFAFYNFFNTIGHRDISIKSLYPTLISAVLFFPLLSWTYGATGTAAATFLSTFVWLTAYFVYYYNLMKNWNI